MTENIKQEDLSKQDPLIYLTDHQVVLDTITGAGAAGTIAGIVSIPVVLGGAIGSATGGMVSLVTNPDKALKNAGIGTGVGAGAGAAFVAGTIGYGAIKDKMLKK